MAAEIRATFLLSDIEGSTLLARELGPAWGPVVAAHNELVGVTIAAHGGTVERIVGDAFLALFPTAEAAAGAASAVHRVLGSRSTPHGFDAVRVRIGVHTGCAERVGDELVGLDLHLVARIEAAANGGQTVLSSAAARDLPATLPTVPLGGHLLAGFPDPEPLFLLDDDDDGGGPVALRVPAVRATNIPEGLPTPVGRAAALAAIEDLLLAPETSPVTLLGPGGVGKTRLALAIGAQMLPRFPGGVWVAPLAGIDTAAALLARIATALGVGDAAERPLAEAIADRLAVRPTLLVLDTFEHLAGAAAELVPLLRDPTASRILVTSQLPLRVAGERRVAVAALAPGDAEALFVERAGARLDGGADRAAIATICDRVDGMPLAIELAAARLDVMGLQDLADRVTRSTSVLARGDRDVPARQRSLRATLTWTIGLLGEDERTLFARLAAFVGPAPLDAVEALAEVPGGCGRPDTIEALAGLLDASLVRRTDSPVHGVRYVVPQAARDVAAEMLAASGEEHAVRCGQALHVAALAERCRYWFPGPGDAARAAVLALEAEQPVALAWTRDHAPAVHQRLASALGAILMRTGRPRRAADELEIALERFGVTGAIGGWAAAVLGLVRNGFGDVDGGRALVDPALAALRAAGDEELLFWGLLQTSQTRFWSTDFDAAADLMAEAVAVARRRGDVTALAVALCIGAQPLVQVGRLDEADVLLAEAETLAPETRDTWFNRHTSYADLAFARGDWSGAAVAYARSAVAAERIGSGDQLLVDLQCTAIALSAAGAAAGAAEVDEVVATVQRLTGEVGLGPLEATLRRRLPTGASLDAIDERAARARGRAVALGDCGARSLALALQALPDPVAHR